MSLKTTSILIYVNVLYVECGVETTSARVLRSNSHMMPYFIKERAVFVDKIF